MTTSIIIGNYSSPLPEGTVTIRASTKESLATCLTTISSSITIYINAHELSSHYDPLGLASVVSNLAPGGSLSIQAPVTNDDSVDWDVITKSFLLAGLNAESEKRDGNGGRVYTARKAAPAGGASKINLKGKVTLSLDDDDNDNIIDEDDLLSGAQGGLLAPPSMEAKTKSADDCGGRKPCDNCTCGRADRVAGEIQEEKKEQLTSSCGNCAKGDAFRCAGCPYLGKPAFKEGEEHLVLNLTDDV
eukprot:scaffold40491_cov65-Cyclotella_meneghiniana.AAC.3